MVRQRLKHQQEPGAFLAVVLTLLMTVEPVAAVGMVVAQMVVHKQYQKVMMVVTQAVVVADLDMFILDQLHLTIHLDVY